MKQELNTRLTSIRKKYNISASDFIGAEITHGCPDKFKLMKSGRCYVKKADRTYQALGYYRSGKHPRISVAPGFHPAVLIHEVGHHVTMTKTKDLITTAKNIVREVKFTERQLRHLGLIRYSVSHGLEFLADCYRVLHMGTPEKQRNLIRFCNQHGLDIVSATTTNR